MKTNKTMRLASALLVAVLITTCAISGTFAKYVTTASANDTARVAKFGINLSATGNTFTDKYDTDDAATVISSTTEDVVAPGTASLENTVVTINGQAEVAVKVEMSLGTTEDVFLKAANGKYYDFTTAKTDDTFDLEKDYYPVVFTLVHTYTNGNPIKPAVTTATGATITTDGKKETVTGTLAQINAVLANIAASMENVPANYVFDDTFTLTWAWAFNGNDMADTVLGNLADGDKVAADTITLTDGTDYNLGLAYTFNITVTQVD